MLIRTTPTPEEKIERECNEWRGSFMSNWNNQHLVEAVAPDTNYQTPVMESYGQPEPHLHLMEIWVSDIQDHFRGSSRTKG